MRVTLPTVVVLVSCLSLAGCSKGDVGAKNVDPATVKLDQVGLQIDLAGDARVSKHWAGGEAVTINTGSMKFGTAREISVEVLERAKTADEVNAQLSEDTKNKDVNVETLSDGFVATYNYLNPTLAKQMEVAEVYRTIGGRTVLCKCQSTGAELVADALAACKTLRE
jgi:hypothetical protein